MNTLSPSTLSSGVARLGREYFSSYASLVNSSSYASADGGQKSFPGFDVGSSFAGIGDRVRDTVKVHGACLVHTGTRQYSEVLEEQEFIFGKSLPDSTGASVSRIAVSPGRKYYAGSSVGQPMHSDDAHLVSPPRLISLYCEKQSKHGGITTLAGIGSHLESVCSRIPEACFAEDAITILGSAGALQRPLVVEADRPLCAFPSILMEASGAPEVIEFYRELMEWCHMPQNQTRLRLAPGDLLFIDNFRVLHGRTQFPAAEPRTLLRACFGGVGL